MRALHRPELRGNVGKTLRIVQLSLLAPIGILDMFVFAKALPLYLTGTQRAFEVSFLILYQPAAEERTECLR